MSLRLLLICSASTNGVRSAAFPADEPLDAQGHTSAAALSGELGSFAIVRTSPALRARETAASLGLAASVDPALRDLDVGRWAGRPLTEIEAAEPAGLAAWTSDIDAAPHGGEAIAALLERTRLWLDACRTRRGRILAVTHAAVIRAAVIHAIDAKPSSFWRIDVAPLCRADLRSNGERWVLRALRK
jgi:broad specificity phosphatase PhoE